MCATASQRTLRYLHELTLFHVQICSIDRVCESYLRTVSLRACKTPSLSEINRFCFSYV